MELITDAGLLFSVPISECINRVLKASKHEEQAYNACAGILHSVKDLPHGVVEETARQCIQMGSCRYKTFKQVLNKLLQAGKTDTDGSLPTHDNIRGKGFYK